MGLTIEPIQPTFAGEVSGVDLTKACLRTADEASAIDGGA
jgi:hypothetical protein